MLRLEPVTRDNWRQGLSVRASEEQLHFVADYQPVLLVILAKAAVEVGAVVWWPYLLLDDDTTGVVAVTDNRQRHNALTIFHLLIDQPRQRRGYGRAALAEIIDLGRRTIGCDTLQLTVHLHNAPAIKLYRSVGFRETGTNDNGELDMSLVLQPGTSR